MLSNILTLRQLEGYIIQGTWLAMDEWEESSSVASHYLILCQFTGTKLDFRSWSLPPLSGRQKVMQPDEATSCGVSFCTCWSLMEVSQLWAGFLIILIKYLCIDSWVLFTSVDTTISHCVYHHIKLYKVLYVLWCIYLFYFFAATHQFMPFLY